MDRKFFTPTPVWTLEELYVWVSQLSGLDPDDVREALDPEQLLKVKRCILNTIDQRDLKSKENS